MTKQRDTQDTLRTLGVTPDKAFGQNFVQVPSVIDDIIRFGKPQEGEVIVEIGPGLGALTKELATFGPMHAVEIEHAFAKYIREHVRGVTVHEDDIRGFDLSEIGSDLVIFGNIPYSFSSEILFYLLDNALRNGTRMVKRAVLLVQKEFAERVASGPGPKIYGIPSVRTAILANTRLGPVFPGDIFYPVASVESQVLELRFLAEPRFTIADDLHFKHLLAVCFGTRRRKIFNSLSSSGQYNETVLSAALNDLAIDPDSRVEAISPEQFVGLSNRLFASSSA